MSHVVVIGCGVIGAAIAYELSQVPGLKITVLDQQPPAQEATSASLGVLMGAVVHKVKGKPWQMRQSSLRRYETLIPELEALTGRQIPYNRQGVLMLCFAESEMAGWQSLVEIRAAQNWHLEIWDTAQVHSQCPQLSHNQLVSGIYSPQDRQVDPVALTLALIEAAQQNGVNFNFGVNILGNVSEAGVCRQIQTTVGPLTVDWLVVSAGLGSRLLTQELGQLVDIQPVLGQALHLGLDRPLGNPDFQPVISGNDVHIVPVGVGEYWVGATLEFPDGREVVADGACLEQLREKAIAFCPDLADATTIKHWSGLRPRPECRPAPVIGRLTGYTNVLLATGHYRNGILLAPATAQAIRQLIQRT